MTDIDGAPVVTCSAKFFSMSGRRAILDPQGKKLFEMTEIFFSWRMTFVGKDDEGNVLFQLKRRSSCEWALLRPPRLKVRCQRHKSRPRWPLTSVSSSKMEVEFTNIATGQPVRLLVKGDWRARNAIIEIENGEPVAQIKRTVWDVRNILQDKQTYFVDVAPGVDLALIAAVCIGLDEMENDGRRR